MNGSLDTVANILGGITTVALTAVIVTSPNTRGIVAAATGGLADLYRAATLKG